MPAKFMAAVKDTTFELQVSEGTVDVVDSQDTSKGQQVTHVGPNMTFSNTGVLQNNNNQSNLTTGQRVAIIIAAGGVLALVLAILTGDDPVADGPGGCVVVPSGLSPQNPC
jgi:anaerobic glycerol-3-phosphate dehydrogenase